VFRHVILPSAAPMILTGLQIALAAAFSTVVSAELLAATNGLGQGNRTSEQGEEASEIGVVPPGSLKLAAQRLL
jgi:ABC-type nitrate/sulfonate/bicarbonate transport system permease component